VSLLISGGEALAWSPWLSRSTVARLESRLHLPEGADSLQSYARWYTLTRLSSVDDEPFATLSYDLPIHPGEPVVLGLLALPNGVSVKDKPGVRIVGDKRFPVLEHGGCEVVNVVYSPGRDEIVGTWCNFDDLPPGERARMRALERAGRWNTPSNCAKPEDLTAEENSGAKAAFVGEVEKIRTGSSLADFSVASSSGLFWLKPVRPVKGALVRHHGPFDYNYLATDDGQVSGHKPQIGERYLAFQLKDGDWGTQPLCDQPP
jgi:hypothetical protein